MSQEFEAEFDVAMSNWQSPLAYTANGSLCGPLDDISSLLQDTEHLHQ